ncbi:TRAF-interacting protein [Ooceraea biroi]|uniref:TRAF-interacting protein n=1 Tax=Ooceraea biroi TaxID=2015173 RepID=A0A026WKH5_OOCBI|nr:TRAF-interacting protein [Ooceraea biroi]
MNILCNICQELLTPSDTLLVIYCGHLFHNNCLTRWLKRQASATCPQCRQEATEGKIHKVYFTHENDKTITEIADFALEEQVNNLKFQILLKEKDINFYTTKSANLEKQNVGLRQLVREVESEIKQKNSIIQDLMEKIVDLQKIQLECASFKKRLSEKEKELQEYREKEFPGNPRGPIDPCSPICPLLPFWPGFPLNPGGPGFPIDPSKPRDPGKPGSPRDPGGPLLHARTNKTHIIFYIKNYNVITYIYTKKK